jgi:endonuclease/exonuclease/phosphatase family metal-dependent hydrolase
MATAFRVASFNCENLFSRAKILNLRNHDVASDLLSKVEKFNKLIHKDGNFTANEKEKILALIEELKDYIDVRENRGKKLFNRAKTKVVASGGRDWEGEIEFKRDKFTELTRENTAKVFKTVKAAVACVIEAEDRWTLKAFSSQLLGTHKFKYSMLIDGNDLRGIDVGVLSNFPIASLRTHIYDGTAQSPTFPRDCLRAELTLPGGEALHLLCNHFTSKSNGEAATDPKRRRQADRVVEILGDYDLETDLVIVAGDLNDTPDRTPLRPLLELENLFDVLALQFPDEPEKRWTYHYQTKEQIDYMLVSKPLKSALVEAGVERRGIFQLSQLTDGAETEFDTITHYTNAASDHGAVWADFELS